MDHKRGLAIAGVVGALSLLTAGGASAHAKLVTSNPTADAVVQAPRVISLTFNEKLAPAFSSFDLVMVDHGMKVPVKTVVSKDGKTITGTPQGAFMKGAYKITWHAASADGHRMTGEVNFKVN